MMRFDKRIMYFLLFLFSMFIGFALFPKGRIDEAKTSPTAHSDLELTQIKKTKDIKEQSRWYLRLIERVGPVKAQEALQHSGLPYSGQGHLLNHVVGNYLYKTEGPRGIIKCKDYFSSSCYHGVVIDAIGEGKLDELTVMLDACRGEVKATYTGCVHALGHGFLAYQGYSQIPAALAMCDDMEKRVDDFQIYYCYNGVFMENIWGLHGGKPSPDRWIDPNDYHYPCNDPRVEQKHLSACWYNQPFQILRYVKGDYVKVAKVCDELQDKGSEITCFDGIFRSLHAKTQNDLTKKLDTCLKMPEDWIDTCFNTEASASFQQGDRDLPYKICEQARKNNKADCYKEIVHMISYYTAPSKHPPLCKKIPTDYRAGICKM